MLQTWAKLAYEANLGIVYGSTLVVLLLPLMGSFMPPSLVSSISKLNAFTLLESYLLPALSSFGIFGGLALGVGTAITFSVLNSIASSFLNLSSTKQQGLTLVVSLLVSQFIFGGWATFSLFLTSMLSSVPPVPGLAVIMSFIAPFIDGLIATLGGLMVVLSILYTLSEIGLITLP
ncbi:hypothetical protein [Acidianus two-tailed virus 2]|nr:hypothetical protein [Acidianus two-tailed virus 2]